MNFNRSWKEKLLQDRLRGPSALAAPFTFDIRGGGGFWGIEFDFTSLETVKLDFNGDQFAMLVQARALEKGLITMGFVGGANLEGTKGDHILLAPPYNVTKDEIEKIVDLLVESVEEVLRESAI
jgi:E3 ubiquitin-protein ligase TRIP12